MSDPTKLGAVKLAAGYFLAAGLWILLWDALLLPRLLPARAVSWPAWGWATLSTAALYAASLHLRQARKQTEEKLTRSREQLRSLAARLQSIREEERTRIAREIHDELGQALTGVKMDLAWLAARLRADQGPLAQRLHSTSSLVDNTIQTVRKIATELRPGVLDNLGLPAALEWQAAEFTKHTGIPCACTSHLQPAELAPLCRTVLFRIFQETLTNVARHAGATRVDVQLSETNNQVQLQIRDNGRGITPEQLAGSRSLGLLGIRERAATVGGQVRIEGQPQKGTSVTVTIPHTPSPPTRHDP